IQGRLDAVLVRGAQLDRRQADVAAHAQNGRHVPRRGDVVRDDAEAVAHGGAGRGGHGGGRGRRGCEAADGQRTGGREELAARRSGHGYTSGGLDRGPFAGKYFSVVVRERGGPASFIMEQTE